MLAVHSLLVLASIAAAGDDQLLCFGATWCEPCRQMQPVISQLADAGFPLQKIDVDQRQDLARHFQVAAIPSFILTRNGQVLDRIDGAVPYQALAGMLAKHGLTPTTTVRGQSPGGLAQISSAVLGAVTPARRDASPPGRMPLLQQAPNDPRPTHAASASPGSAAERALAASVRLRVEDASGHSYGTGTVIDVHGQEALVLTCGHIFRDSGGQGAIVVDRAGGRGEDSVAGTLVAFDLSLDVGLVSMPLTSPLESVALASSKLPIRPGAEVFSVGCNHGQRPTVVAGRVNAVNKYMGPANITASGRPVDGRSGGGLFSQEGTLIGVCNAADPTADEGLYAALPSIHQLLDRHGLSFVHQRNDSIHKPSPAALAGQHDAPRSLTPGNPGIQSPGRAAVVPTSTTAPTNVLSGIATESSSGADQAAHELVCVIRDANGGRRVIVVDRPSPELLGRLMQAADTAVR